jgi:hypothetical protein
MSTRKLLVRLPHELVARFKRHVPAHQRNAFVQRLIEAALPADDKNDALYQTALAVEQDASLAAEMAEWENVTAADGLAPGHCLA